MYAQLLGVRMDHVARLDLAPDAGGARVCSVCGLPVTGADTELLHVGEVRRPRIRPARADMAAVQRAELVAARALDELAWTPHLDSEARAAAVVEALYAAGLIVSRPRDVRPRATARPVRSRRPPATAGRTG